LFFPALTDTDANPTVHVMYYHYVGLIQSVSVPTESRNCLSAHSSRSGWGSANVWRIDLQSPTFPFCWPNYYAAVWSLVWHQVRQWRPSMPSSADHQRRCG